MLQQVQLISCNSDGLQNFLSATGSTSESYESPSESSAGGDMKISADVNE